VTSQTPFEIFLVATPGLEAPVLAEALELGFTTAHAVPGGVAFNGVWKDVWRANLELRGTSKVLARIASFHANHLAQLDKRARSIPWGQVLDKRHAVRVEATCKRSKIYHSGAAAQRIATAITEELRATVKEDADITVMARIEDNLVTVSLDTSGELLHKRGAKQAIAKASIRETLAAMFLRQCGFDGTEPVIDPMCGSGTFVIEAAEIAAGLKPGRKRSFAFEKFKTFDAKQWAELRNTQPRVHLLKFNGFDRDAGAIKACTANAERAGVSNHTSFHHQAITRLAPPDGPKGLVICNPPYGARIGDKQPLLDLYASFGKALRENFHGWRVGFVCTDTKLARATGLKLSAGPSVLHGGLRIKLYQSLVS
jgi:putative N6-adenine-specific DNA methylase